MTQPTAIPRLLTLLGLMSTACVVSIHDGGWGDPQECFDEYGDCMDDADNDSEYAACDKTLDACLDQSHADEAGDGDGDGDGDSTDTSTTASEGTDDAPPHGDSGDGDGDGDTGTDTGVDPQCFELYATCIETLQDVETCQVLFDHCVDPGECETPDCGCPEGVPVG